MRLLTVLFLFTAMCCNKENVGPAKKVETGIVFYTFKEGDIGYIPGENHGYMAYKEDLEAIWGCQDANGSEISPNMGYGQSNTKIIIRDCGHNNAAFKCDSLGYWLPSYYEARLLMQSNIAISLKSGASYWTSTKNDYFNGVSLIAGSINPDNTSVYQKLYFRPIKSF